MRLYAKMFTLDEARKNYLLKEVYRKTDKFTCFVFFAKLKDYYNGKISVEDFISFLEENNFGLEIVENENSKAGGAFNATTAKIEMRITTGFVEILKSSNSHDLSMIQDQFWETFVHEDTHLQQQTKSKIKIKNSYIVFESPEDIYDLDRNRNYYNNVHEVDSIARECGEKLKKFYDFTNYGRLDVKAKNTLMSTVFDDIRDNKVKDTNLVKTINIYKDPRIDNTNRYRFFKTLYEYLEGDEEQD